MTDVVMCVADLILPFVAARREGLTALVPECGPAAPNAPGKHVALCVGGAGDGENHLADVGSAHD